MYVKGFPLPQKAGACLPGERALHSILICHYYRPLLWQRILWGKAGEKCWKNSCKCYGFLACLKLIPKMDSFVWRTNCTMTTTLVSSLLFAKREAEVPKSCFTFAHNMLWAGVSLFHTVTAHTYDQSGGLLGSAFLITLLLDSLLGHSAH